MDNNLSEIVYEYEWKLVPEKAIGYARSLVPIRELLKSAAITHDLPDVEIYCRPSINYKINYENCEVPVIVVGSHEKTAKWKKIEEELEPAYIRTAMEVDFRDYDPPWLRIKIGSSWTVQDVFGPMGHASGWKDNKVTRALGGPNTLTASLGSGLLGAGLGYGAGALVEHLAPEGTFKKGKLRKVTGLMGLGLGALPAVWAGSRGWFKPNIADEALKQANEDASTNVDRDIVELVEKEANNMLMADGAEFMPQIPVDSFNKTVLSDPNTPYDIRMATYGLVQGASEVRNKSPWVAPIDIARIAMGAGSGYVSGLLVGKTLGALAGLSEQAQQSLQRAGIWAGVLKNTIPLAFRS